MLWHLIVTGLICLAAGFWLGGISGRKAQRVARDELSSNSLNILNNQSRFIQIESRNIDIERKEKLLQTMRHQLEKSISDAQKSDDQAQKSDLHVRKLQQDLITFAKKQKVTHALWKQKAQDSHNLAVQSHKKAMEAVAFARKTELHLKQLKSVATASEKISSTEPKFHGANENANFGVIDRPKLEFKLDKKMTAVKEHRPSVKQIAVN